MYNKPESKTFEQVMLEFLKHSQRNKRSYDNDTYRARTLAKHFAGREINTLSNRDVQHFIMQRQEENMKNSTINRELALLSSAINHCNKKLDWDLPNKVMGHSLPEPQGRIRWITEEEAEHLIGIARKAKQAPYLADFIIIALHTGCRCGELLQLTWQAVDLKQNIIVLEQTKSGKRRSIPINSTARKAFLSRMNYRATHCPAATRVFCNRKCQGIDTIKQSFNTACRKAEIEDFHIHDMRHTCAAWLVMRGVPLIVVRDLLGHASVKTTEIYAHLSPDNVRAGVAELDKPRHEPVTVSQSQH